MTPGMVLEAKTPACRNDDSISMRGRRNENQGDTYFIRRISGCGQDRWIVGVGYCQNRCKDVKRPACPIRVM